MSSSFRALPTPLKENYPKLPASFQVSSGREMMKNSVPLQESSLAPSNRAPGNSFSPPSIATNDMHSPVPTHNQHSQNPAFVSQSSKDLAPLLPINSSFLEQSTALIPHENKDASWSLDRLQDFLDLHENVPGPNGLVGSNNGTMLPEVNTKKTDWLEWADQLISVNDPLDSDWSEFLDNTNVSDPKPKVCP